MSDVRLSVTQLDPQQLGRPGTILLDVIEDDATVAERAIAWATVRGYDRLVPALQSILGGPAPESGVAEHRVASRPVTTDYGRPSSRTSTTRDRAGDVSTGTGDRNRFGSKLRLTVFGRPDEGRCTR